MSDQTDWRYCGNCGGLFFDGYPDNKGVCAKGGAHTAISWKFILPWVPAEEHVDDTSTTQAQWRYCGNCGGLFFDGYPDNKGVCPKGGGHQSQGWQFVLPCDVPPTPTTQGEWRYCGNCGGLFFDGYPDNKGVCPKGGGHASIGSHFVLPHPIDPKLRLVNDGSEIQVVGQRFTLSSGVTVDYGYETPGLDGVTHTTRGQVVTSTDVDGDLPVATTFAVPARAFNIGARAVDHVTGQAADAATIRAAID